MSGLAAHTRYLGRELRNVRGGKREKEKKRKREKEEKEGKEGKEKKRTRDGQNQAQVTNTVDLRVRRLLEVQLAVLQRDPLLLPLELVEVLGHLSARAVVGRCGYTKIVSWSCDQQWHLPSRLPTQFRVNFSKVAKDCQLDCVPVLKRYETCYLVRSPTDHWIADSITNGVRHTRVKLTATPEVCVCVCDRWGWGGGCVCVGGGGSKRRVRMQHDILHLPLPATPTPNPSPSAARAPVGSLAYALFSCGGAGAAGGEGGGLCEAL